MTGYDTAGRIQDTYVSAHHEFGANPNFWIRYFTPSPAADLFHKDALAESRGAWDSGGPYIGCHFRTQAVPAERVRGRRPC